MSFRRSENSKSRFRAGNRMSAADRAFEWLDAAVVQNDTGLSNIAIHDIIAIHASHCAHQTSQSLTIRGEWLALIQRQLESIALPI